MTEAACLAYSGSGSIVCCLI